MLHIKYSLITILLLLLNITGVQAQSWTSLGPSGVQGAGSGRLFAIDYHPNAPDSIFVGGMGGAWKSGDGGNSYTMMNTDDQLYPVSTVGSIAVDQNNPNYIYMSTGTPLSHKGSIEDGSPNDFTMMSIPTTGVYRSSDRGTNWTLINNGLPASITSLDYNQGGRRAFINQLVIAPYDPQILFAITSVGIFKTTNARATNPSWTMIPLPAGDVSKQYWLHFEPGSTSSNYTIYACNEAGVKYTTDLINWNWITGTLPGMVNVKGEPEFPVGYTGFFAYAMDIHPTIPGIRYISVYVKDREFLYKYNGTGWTKVSVYNYTIYDGSAARHNIVIDRVQPKRVMLGGGFINYYFEGPPVQTLQIANTYFGNYGHGDHRFLKISPHNNYRYLYSCNDGFLTKIDLQANLSTQAATVPINNYNLCNAWISDVSVHPTDSKRFTMGLMDDGVFYSYNGVYAIPDGGDGYTNYTGYNFNFTSNGSGTPYASYWTRSYNQNGSLSASAVSAPVIPNGESQTFSIQHNVYDALTSNNDIYIASNNLHLYTYSDLIKQTKYVKQLSTFPSDGKMITGVAVYPLNPSIAYVARGRHFMYEWCTASSGGCTDVYKTNNLTAATSTWTKLASVPDVEWATIRDIEVSPIDPNVVFLAYSDNGYGYKVIVSYDGGNSWANYNNSQTLPNIQEIAYENGTHDRIYVTTTNGVFYTEKGMTAWNAYNTGYPKGITSRRLYINERENIITTSTMGRGVWQGYLFCSPAANLTLSGNVNLCRAWETKGTIASTAVLANGANQVNVSYRAGSQIDLKPGFKATANTWFHAYISPCGGAPIVQPVSPYRIAGEEAIASEEEFEHEKEEEHIELPDEGITVFPNPTLGEIELVVEELKQWEGLKINIYSLDGKPVASKIEEVISNKQYKINLYGNPPGYYLLQCSSGSKKQVYKRILLKEGTIQNKDTSTK